jgi:septum formation protein
MWLKNIMQKIILASQSPRRKMLLEWAEIPFEIITYPTDELIPEGVAIEDVPVHIAREKALAVRQKLVKQDQDATVNDNYPVLAADTVVVLDDDIIGKPQNREQAIKILTRLAGRTHRVITGVIILFKNDEIAFSDITIVEFHPLTQQQITFYVDKYQPYDKAGAYAIQEWIGVTGIKSINGDFYNVMGLPVSRVVQALKQLE